MSPIRVDANTFHGPLFKASERMVQKLHRELRETITKPPHSAPDYVPQDMIAIFRQAMWTTNLLFYLHADERLQNDSNWRPAYTFAAVPLVRSNIDALYNLIRLLEDPCRIGTAYRRAGYRKAWISLEKERQRYGNDPQWTDYLNGREHGLRVSMLGEAGIRPDDLTKKDQWHTLGAYLNEARKHGHMSASQNFLETFAYGDWAQYPAMSHGGFEGLMDIAAYFTRDFKDVSTRETMDERYGGESTKHIMQAATLVLCILTELKVKFPFEDATLDADI